MPATKSSRTRVIEVLKDLAKLCALAEENHFKTRAYTRAVDTFEEMNDDFFDKVHYFEGLDGIGEKIAQKINDIRDTGTCNKFEELMAEYGDRLPLMSIKGIGAKTANKLWDEYLVRSIDDLKEMVKDGSIPLKAVQKAVKNMIVKKSLPLDEAIKISDELTSLISQLDDESTFGAIEACGSVRRRKDIVGDLDIVVEVLNPDKLEILSNRIASMILDAVTARGLAKVSGQYEGMQVDVRFAEPVCYGSMILSNTGPRQFNIDMREWAAKRGLLLNEYGVWEGANRIAGKTEKEVFAALQIEYVHPEERKSNLAL